MISKTTHRSTYFPTQIGEKNRHSSFSGKTLVVIPTYNEVKNISALIKELLSFKNININVLVVDDNSPDKTADSVKALASNDSRIFLIEREKLGGLGSAYIAGFKFALQRDYDFIFEMDADFSHSPQMIPYFLEEMKHSWLVIGSRYLGKVANVINWPITRLLLSKSASLYTRIITGMPIQDPTSGYKCFRREALMALNLDDIHSSGYSFQIELNFKLWKKNFRITEIPIVFVDRVAGSSKMNRKIVFEAIRAVWLLKFKSLMNRL